MLFRNRYMTERVNSMDNLIKIGIIGDYEETKPSHRATENALRHSAASLSLQIALTWLPTPSLAGGDMAGYDALFCAPGSPYQSCAGALTAIRYARENNIPFIGTCGGFQHAVMEFAVNVLGLADVDHEELNPGASAYVVKALSCSLAGQTAEIILKENTVSRSIYRAALIMERFNCSYGLNPDYLEGFHQNGFLVSGVDVNGEVRILEMPQKRFYIVSLFQPQLGSTPEQPHPLLNRYLSVAAEYHLKRTVRGYITTITVCKGDAPDTL
jgi:CTP synthase (UTP-ammonia lyase)